MFEVIPHGDGFVWRILSAGGRVLVYTGEVFACDLAAANAAKAYRAGFQAVARDVDHRPHGRLHLMGYLDVTNADVFALTRRRRAERAAWIKKNIGGVAYWGTQEAADAAAERYAAWCARGKPPSPPAVVQPPKGKIFLVPGTLPRLGRVLFRLQDGACYLTGEPFTRMNPPTWEHVVPKSKGGINFRNRLLAGSRANNLKGNRDPYPCELLYLEAIYCRLDAEMGEKRG